MGSNILQIFDIETKKFTLNLSSSLTKKKEESFKYTSLLVKNSQQVNILKFEIFNFNSKLIAGTEQGIIQIWG